MLGHCLRWPNSEPVLVEYIIFSYKQDVELILD